MKEKNLPTSNLDETFITDAILKESGLNKVSMLKIMRGFKGNSNEELEKYAESVKRIRSVEEKTHLSMDKLQDVVTEEEEILPKLGRRRQS